MPSEVRHQIDAGQTYPVVRLTGVLDDTTAPAVRAALLEVLADQPEAVIVEVSELAIGEHKAVTVLGSVAAETADWPGSHVVISAGAGGDTWHDSGLPVWPSPAEAFGALGTPAPGHFLNVSLEPIMGAARRSRELVTEACGRWDLPELAASACIVVTEMVNNVVAHARTSMTIMLGRHGDTMSVAVRDHSTTVPRFSGEPVPVTSYGGRGLLLIDSVSLRWGSLVLPGGKVVWAVLDGDDELPTEVPAAGMTGHPRG
ncbi:ATP-binding protein [Actinoplanes friuliensis]|uniref:STAS domain-containing protein n=1 Tax=Actinoplanes friuliensis DSM 7358 TaxID=1246995 RepID=U5WD58_9ACTN|nr:ATP-binding protein [Actinoplanes friuliensis]AGZ45886.1 hypothetical protein AFR_38160 [Actinoplanes friuliensis DSM 7358]